MKVGGGVAKKRKRGAMAVYEILFDVSEGPKDGKPLVWKFKGTNFSVNEWNDYLADDQDTPGGWGPDVRPTSKRAYGRLRADINSASSGQTDEARRVEIFGTNVRSLSSVSVNAGGTGYSVGDILGIDGTGGVVSLLAGPATLRVAAVSSGVVVSVTVNAKGSYSTDPTTVVGNASTGGGTGATFDLTFADDAELKADQISFLDERMTQALAADTLIQANGEDTNWGTGDLMEFGVLLADLSANEIDQMFMTKLKATPPLIPQDAESARSERILYESPVFTPARVARWRDPSDRVPVNRNQTPFLYSDNSWHELV